MTQSIRLQCNNDASATKQLGTFSGLKHSEVGLFFCCDTIRYPLVVLHSSSTRYINQNLIELSSNRVCRILWDIYHHIFKLKSEHQALNKYFNFSTNRQWKTFDLFRRSPCCVGQFVNTNIFLAWLVPP